MSWADEIQRLEREADEVLELARADYEDAVRRVDACRAVLMAAEDAALRRAGRARRAIRPRVLMARETS